MNKLKIFLGVFVLTLAVIVSGFFTDTTAQALQSTVFEYEATLLQNEAGKFEGEGFYAIGSQADLKATMNPGYMFDAWIVVDESGNELFALSTELEYSFVVEENIIIKPKWHKIEYKVSLSDDLNDDFSLSVTNIAGRSVNYYNDSIRVAIGSRTGETGRYIYDLSLKNVFINGKSFDDIISGENDISLTYNLVNGETGFSAIEFTFKIKEDVVVSINYDYMHTLTLQSLDEDNAPISDILQFIQVSNSYGTLADDKYLVWSKQAVTISVTQGNSVYKFSYSKFEDEENNVLSSQTLRLEKDSVIKFLYTKIAYQVEFKSYLKNDYGNFDALDTVLYSIDNFDLKAGEQLNISYNAEIININDRSYTKAGVVGYRFLGITKDKNFDSYSNSLTFTMDANNPTNYEIQILFELIKYNLNIKLVDEYFASNVKYELNTNYPTVKTLVSAKASSEIYDIKGWSWVLNPTSADYKSTENIYTFNFEPEDDDDTREYVLYLDVQYRYITATYSLSLNNIIKNMDYDVVSLDEVNKVLTFKDSDAVKSTVVINYTDEDVTNSGGITIINTKNDIFGEVVFENNKITYKGLTVYSGEMVEVDGLNTYTFEKYTYFANLEIAKINEIEINESGSSVSLTLKGVAYNEKTSRVLNLQTFNSTMIYDEKVGAYKVNYDYPMYIYKTEGETGEFLKLTLLGKEFAWNGTSFYQTKALINTPLETGVVGNKKQNYSVQLTNLLSDDVLMFISHPSESYYRFKSNNQNGANLYVIALADNYIGSMVQAQIGLQVVAEYIKLKKDITLNINNEKAYSGENVEISVNGEISSGLTITATNGNSVMVTIYADKISVGYKFDGYKFEGAFIETSNVLSFVMDVDKYADKIIELNFSVIEYTINLQYLDDEGNPITDLSNLKGKLSVNETDLTNSLMVLVNIDENYTFVINLNDGYYVKDAYIGTQAYSLTSLIQSNDSVLLRRSWNLNNENFISAIVSNVDSSNEVQMYIQFAVHKYTASVYFEIDRYADKITYPIVMINDNILTVEKVNEKVEVGGSFINKTRYKAFLENVKYAEDVNIRLGSLATGITINGWQDENYKTVGGVQLSVSVLNVKGNVVRTVVLDFIEYNIAFAYPDVERHGSAISSKTEPYKMFDEIKYTVTVNNGYSLSGQYYLDNANEIVDIHTLETPLVFEPAKFRIEENGSFIIYLKFSLKEFNISVLNKQNDDMVNKFGKSLDELISYNVFRLRGEQEFALDNDKLADEQSKFVMGDVLKIIIYPSSIGLDLDHIMFDTQAITLSSAHPYVLELSKDEENKRLIYTLLISVDADVITKLSKKVDIIINWTNRNYSVVYNYNFIEKQFNIQLAVRNLDTGSTKVCSKDTAYTDTIAFGTSMLFTCNQATLDNVISKKFKVLGFIVGGQEFRNGGQPSFELNGLELWENLSWNRYNSTQPGKIEITLKLSPKITLYNMDDGEGYLYTRTYKGVQQGLVKGEDVAVEGDFEIIIQYLINGVYTISQPKNVGEYDVKISAQINVSGEDMQVDFDDRVTYKIIEAKLKVVSAFSQTNPLSKIYDGTNNVNIDLLYTGLRLEGLFSGDIVNIDKSSLEANYSGTSANVKAKTLYDITVKNIILRYSSVDAPKNYELLLGNAVTFEGIGKITPRALTIVGFEVYDKVYDESENVVVNMENIGYTNVVPTDSAKISASNLRFYLEDFTIGRNRKVIVDYSEALTGADSVNYTVTYLEKYIDIYPYEKECKIDGFGTFKIVDRDKKCLIPIEAEFSGTAYVNGSPEYKNVFPKLESLISQNEDFMVYYEFKMKNGVVTSSVPTGLYLFIPANAKLSKIVQVNDKMIEQLPFTLDGDYNITKIQEGKFNLAIIHKTTYISLWVIILIVGISLLLILLLILVFVIIRRKKEKYYSDRDKL